MKEGGAFAEIYRWCPVCEEVDTEPMEINFAMVTPTEPMWRAIEWDNDWGDCE
jgi:hypothetical protein